MKRNYEPAFDFRFELVPIIGFCILLNIVPLYVRQMLAENGSLLSSVYFDMTGTVLASMILGPWWAALVGVIGSTVSGLFTSDYFPFVIVNIGGGIALGYFFATTHAVESISSVRRTKALPFLKVYGWALLIVGFACGALSWVVMVVLYPPMRVPLNPNPTRLYDWLHAMVNSNGLDDSRMLSLFIGDMLRDLGDKICVVLFAIVCLQSISFFPLFHKHRFEVYKVEKTSWRTRIRTDGVAIVAFIVVYSVSLIVARILKPEIKFAQSPAWEVINGQKMVVPALNWLANGDVIAMLYFPLLLAVLCFVFASYNQDPALARSLRAGLRKRQSLYVRLGLKHKITTDSIWNSEGLRVIRQDGIYGILISVVTYVSLPAPGGGGLRHELSSSVLILGGAYLMVTITFVYFYFGASRSRTQRLSQLENDLEILNNRTRVGIEVDSRKGSPYSLLSLVSKRAALMAGKLHQNGAASLLSAYSSAGSALFPAGCSGDGLIVCLEDLSEPKLEFIRSAIEVQDKAKANWMVFLFRSIASYDREVLLYLSDHRAKNIVLLGTEDMEKLFEVPHGSANSSAVFEFAELRAKEYFIGEVTSPVGWAYGKSDVETLAQRALPSVRHVIERQPTEATILDIGAGRGRHAIFAAQRGCDVIAVEKDAKTCEELRGLLANSPTPLAIELVQEDFFEYEPSPDANISLIIAAGVLHHAKNLSELEAWVEHIRKIAESHSSTVFFEVLADMRIEGMYQEDRVRITHEKLEALLIATFPRGRWDTSRILGPLNRTQHFNNHGSFLREYSRVDSVLAEYIVTPI